MAPRILSGKAIADAIKAEVADDVSALNEVHNFRPGLTVVRVGDDPASSVYVGNKVRSADEVCIRADHIHLPDETSKDEILETVNRLNSDSDVDGILVQLPLPKHVSEREMLERIDP